MTWRVHNFNPGPAALPLPVLQQVQGDLLDFAGTGNKPTGYVDTGEVLITDKPIAGIDSKDTAWGLDNCWG